MWRNFSGMQCSRLAGITLNFPILSMKNPLPAMQPVPRLLFVVGVITDAFVLMPSRV